MPIPSAVVPTLGSAWDVGRRDGRPPNHPPTDLHSTNALPILEPEYPRRRRLDGKRSRGAAECARPMPAGGRQQASARPGTVRRASGALSSAVCATRQMPTALQTAGHGGSKHRKHQL